MLLSEPQSTPYDLQFNLFGIPVRVHPLFFLLPLILGQGILRDPSITNTGVALLLLCGVFFVSILVHEMGHALAYRFYKMPARIVLYWMGGLAISDFGSWRGARAGRIGPAQKIVISFAGPLAGFLLAGLLVVIVLFALGGKISLEFFGVFPLLLPDLKGTPHAGREALVLVLFIGLFCNVFWNVLNLIPVFPLDGGQIARNFFTLVDPRGGLQTSLILSILAGGALAVFGMMQQAFFMTILFGMMAYSSYQELQYHRGGGGYGGGW
ncbi:MAG TPA: site-2 protease family protein [Pirellulaceae bacterium]|nr:site-2 protease family protein [Pirellulaceae bacterium]